MTCDSAACSVASHVGTVRLCSLQRGVACGHSATLQPAAWHRTWVQCHSAACSVASHVGTVPRCSLQRGVACGCSATLQPAAWRRNGGVERPDGNVCEPLRADRPALCGLSSDGHARIRGPKAGGVGGARGRMRRRRSSARARSAKQAALSPRASADASGRAPRESARRQLAIAFEEQALPGARALLLAADDHVLGARGQLERIA
jgi:hypothetical protein